MDDALSGLAKRDVLVTARSPLTAVKLESPELGRLAIVMPVRHLPAPDDEPEAHLFDLSACLREVNS